MKIRCAHLTVQLVDRQGRDVKGIVSLQLRWYRVTNALTWKYIPCVGFFYPSVCLSFFKALSRFDELEFYLQLLAYY